MKTRPTDLLLRRLREAHDDAVSRPWERVPLADVARRLDTILAEYDAACADEARADEAEREQCEREAPPW